MVAKRVKYRAPTLAFVCSNCRYEFIYKIQRDRVQCRQCKHWAGSADCIVTGERREEVIKIVKDRKLATRIKHNPHLAPDQLSSVVRGSQVPHVKAEAAFKKRAEDLGYKVHRPSWPDYILEKDRKLLFVEVKSEQDDVSVEQGMTFDLLEQNGIPVYLWKKAKDTRKSLYRWGNGIEARKIAGTYRLIRKGAAARAQVRSKSQ